MRGKSKKTKALDIVPAAQVISRPKSLQDLPIEVLERIYVLTKDTKLMPTLNSYFSVNLKLSAHLMFEFMWELFTFDYRAHGLEDLIHCSHDPKKVVLMDSIFDDTRFFLFFRDNYFTFSDRVYGYLPTKYLKADGELTDQEIVLQQVNGDTYYDYPERFYTQCDNFFLYQDMMYHLSEIYSFERPYEPIEEIFKWVFTRFPPYITNWRQIDEAMSLALSMAPVDYEDRIETAEPLIALIYALFDNDSPEDLQVFSDRIVYSTTTDSRIILLEVIISKWHAYQEACLSDPALWRAVHKISNLQVVEIIEKFGGEPQYDIFF